MKGLYAWVGFPSVAVPYERPQRASGRSKFNAMKLFSLAMDGIVSHSTAPLRAWTWLGLLCVAGAALLGLILLVQYFASDRSAPSGFYMTAMVILGFSSLNFITLGIMGEYLGRIYGEVKDRPLYLLRDDDTDPPDSSGEIQRVDAPARGDSRDEPASVTNFRREGVEAPSCLVARKDDAGVLDSTSNRLEGARPRRASASASAAGSW